MSSRGTAADAQFLKPEATSHAFADHGDTKVGVVQASYTDAAKVFDHLAKAGIDFNDVTDTLEREGVEKFEASWIELLASVQTQLGAAQ